jgi:hypothetical protein
MANIFKPPCDEGVVLGMAVAVPCAPRAEPWILAATILGSSMAFIDGTVVNVALPAAVGLALASALCAWIMIGDSPTGDNAAGRTFYKLNSTTTHLLC